jgi:MFS family permease
VSQPKNVPDRPATFGDLLAIGEFRALFSATALSWFGDYLARAAVTALIFHVTGSVALSAGSFAISYLPGLTAGPILAALADRYPHRTVMVICDVARACLIGVVAVPGLPTPAIFVLLFAAAMLNPPFDASRSALLPRIVTGDKYVVALGLQNTTVNIAMVLGYFIGGVAASVFPHVTLAFDAATFVVSAVLITTRIRPRPAALTTAQRTGLLRETMAGFRLVATNPLLRPIAVVVLSASLLAIVPEGLAAAWAGELAKNSDNRGLDQALIMMSVPAGIIVGALSIGRFAAPSVRIRLIRPFTVIVPLALVFALLNPPAIGIAAIGVVAGFALSCLSLPANNLYVQALPNAFRARGFGVIQFGAQVVQLVGVIATGILAERFALHTVVGLWGVGGVGLMIVAAMTWPTSERITAVIDETRAMNAAWLADPDEVGESARGSDGRHRAASTETSETVEPTQAPRGESHSPSWPSPRQGPRHLSEPQAGRVPDA